MSEKLKFFKKQIRSKSISKVTLHISGKEPSGKNTKEKYAARIINAHTAILRNGRTAI